MAGIRLWVIAIVAAIASLTALGCAGLDCDIEVGMGGDLDPADEMHSHLGQAWLAALDDPDSDDWRCELRAAAGYADELSKVDGGYYDGPIFADGLSAAAGARTWADAQREAAEAMLRAMGADGIERFRAELRRGIAEDRRLSEAYRRAGAP